MTKDIKKILNEYKLFDVKVEYTEYGIAYVIKEGKDNILEINPNLKNYPALFHSVIMHEIAHIKNKNVFQDFYLDIRDMFFIKNEIDIIKFHIDNPKSLFCYSPIVPTKSGNIGVNLFLVLLYSIVVIGCLLYTMVMI